MSILKDSALHRLIWIDWMKVIGIYFIVLGHFFSFGYQYIYVFNVPVFFLISGFLCKPEKSSKIFWNKLWYNLIVPTLIICTMYYIYDSTKISINDCFTLFRIKYFILFSLAGMQSSLGTLWFVYTLAILKIFNHYFTKPFFTIALFILFTIFAYIYNHIDLSSYHPLLVKPNAIMNVLVAYPFFLMGIYFQKFKNTINTYNNNSYISIGLFVCFIIILICGNYNGYVWMYNCGYGNTFSLFLLGGFSGSIGIYLISKLLTTIHHRWVIVLSKGTILILGFHVYIIHLLRHYFPNPSFLDIFFSFFIVIMFIPIIIIAEKFFPIILGKYRKG